MDRDQSASVSCVAIHRLVLLVEDDTLIEEWLEHILERAGFTVVKASSGNEAIALLNVNDLNFRALVCDVRLGRGPTGWDVAKRARAQDAHVPVIYISGSAGHRWESEGVPDSLFISKPFTGEQILAAISRLLPDLDITEFPALP